MPKTLLDLSPQPPLAEKRPVTYSRHGIARSDDYAWLRAANWQEVCRDPGTLAADIRAHLEAENDYQTRVMADTEDLRKALFAEMRGRIKEDDSSVPMKDGPFAYGRSFRTGGEQPQFFRTPRDGGKETILIDGDKEAEGKAYFWIGGVGHAPDHGRLVWSYDDNGSEYYTLRFRDATSGSDLADLVPDTNGGGTWDAAGDGVFYCRLDDNHRPSKVFFHRLGTDVADDRLVYEEPDPGFFANVSKTRTNDWIFVSVRDHETTEYHVLSATLHEVEPVLVAAREAGVQYDLEEGGDIFFVLTNSAGAKDFRVMTAPVSDPRPENWSELVPHKPGTLILSIIGFRDFLVRLERADGLPRIVVHERASSVEHAIAFDEDAYSLGLIGANEYDTDIIRFS